ncbi:hypothetical protein BSKO_01654 [Bryopsis sp. KO-2023]|nr:hypothetical protein BSKO_01654 [Bryopsis sp. KO-2023]
MTHTFTLGGAPQPRLYGFSCQNERIPFLRSVSHSGPSLPRLTGWVGLRRRSKVTRSVLTLGAEPEPGNSTEGKEGKEGKPGENPFGKMLDVVKTGYNKGASLIAQPIVAGAMKAIQEGEKRKESSQKHEETPEDRPPQVMKAGEDLANAIRKMGASKTDPGDSALTRVASLVNKGYELSAVAAARSVIALGGKSVEDVVRTKLEAAQINEEREKLEASRTDVLAAAQQDENQDLSPEAAVLKMDGGSAKDSVETVSEEPKPEVAEEQTPVVPKATNQGESPQDEGGDIGKETVEPSFEPVDSAPGLVETQSRFAAMRVDDEGLSDSPPELHAKDRFEASSESADSVPGWAKKPDDFAGKEDPSDSPVEGLKPVFDISSRSPDSTPEVVEKPNQFAAMTAEDEQPSDSAVEDLTKDVFEASSESPDSTPQVVKNPDRFAAMTAEDKESSDSAVEDLKPVFDVSSRSPDSTPEAIEKRNRFSAMMAEEEVPSDSPVEDLKPVFDVSSRSPDSTPEVVENPDRFAAMTAENEEPSDSAVEDLAKASSETADFTPELVNKPDQFAAVTANQDEPSDVAEETLAQSVLEASSEVAEPADELVSEAPNRFAAMTADQDEPLKEGAGDEEVQTSVAASMGKDETPLSNVFKAKIESEAESELEEPRLEASLGYESGKDSKVDPEFSEVLAAEGHSDDVPGDSDFMDGGEEAVTNNEETEEAASIGAGAEDSGESQEQSEKIETVAEEGESGGEKDVNDGVPEAKSEDPEEKKEEAAEIPEPESVAQGAIIESHSVTHNGAVGNHEGDFSMGESKKNDDQVEKNGDHKVKEDSTDSVFSKAVNAGIEVADGASAGESQEEEPEDSEESKDSGESKETTGEGTPSEESPDDNTKEDPANDQPTKSALQVSAIRRDLKSEPPVNIVRPEKGDRSDRSVQRRPALGGLGGLQYIRSYAESGKGPEVEKGETNQYFTPPKILMGKEVNSGKVEVSTGSDAVTRTQQIQDIGTIWWQHGDDNGGNGGGGGGGGGHGGPGGAGEGGWWLQVLISLLMITGVVFAVLKAVLKPKERNAVNNA